MPTRLEMAQMAQQMKTKRGFLDLIAGLPDHHKTGQYTTAVHHDGKIAKHEYVPVPPSLRREDVARRGSAPAQRMGRLNPETPRSVALREEISGLVGDSRPPLVPRTSLMRDAGLTKAQPRHGLVIPDRQVPTKALEALMALYLNKERWGQVGYGAPPDFDPEAARRFLSEMSSRRSAMKKYKRRKRRKRRAESELQATMR